VAPEKEIPGVRGQENKHIKSGRESKNPPLKIQKSQKRPAAGRNKRESESKARLKRPTLKAAKKDFRNKAVKKKEKTASEVFEAGTTVDLKIKKNLLGRDQLKLFEN
jgi:hypothetical protein